jgi:alanine racemase
LMGGQMGQEITAEEMAGWVGTIPYEILCSVGRRVQRIYKG